MNFLTSCFPLHLSLLHTCNANCPTQPVISLEDKISKSELTFFDQGGKAIATWTANEMPNLTFYLNFPLRYLCAIDLQLVTCLAHELILCLTLFWVIVMSQNYFDWPTQKAGKKH
jgi:hypothetical protein